MMMQRLLCLIKILGVFSGTIYTFSVEAQVFHLGMEKGLSNNSVKSIFQDSHGYMWFGTYDGLNRYDGYEIRSYRNKLNNIHSLPHNYISCITEDNTKRLWIGTGQGVAIYDHNFDSFSRLQFHPHWDVNDTQYLQADAKTVEVDKENNVYVGTNGWGMFVKDAKNSVADWIPLQTDDRKNEYTYYYHAPVIRESSTGDIWVFINERGLFLFDKTKKELNPVNKQITLASCITIDQQGNVYIGTDNGVHVLDPITKQYANDIAIDGHSTVHQLTLKDDNLWISTKHHGIVVWNLKKNHLENTYRQTNNANSLSSNTIYSVYIDAENRKWIGTSKGGINILDPGKYRFQSEDYTTSPSALPNTFVRAFAEQGENLVWVGTDGRGLQLWDQSTGRFKTSPDAVPRLPSDIVNSLVKDQRGFLWIATDRGINRFDGTSLTTYHCLPEKGEENKNVEVLFQDREHTLWAATFINGKLYRYNHTKDAFEMFSPKLTDLMVLADGPDNFLWAGNHHQLFKINKQTQTFETYQIGKPVRAIYTDSKQRFWIGTEGKGLLLFNTRTGKIDSTYADDNGLVNNSVLTIEEDNQGNLWLSTFNGLSKFNPDKQEFTNYDQSDGLQSNEFSYGASLKMRDGSFAFGGVNGFNIFHPDSILNLSRTPPVAITQIRVNNVLLSDSLHRVEVSEQGEMDKITLPFNEAMLSLSFAALEYSSPQRVRYRYMLEGWDKDWNMAGTTRSINYNNLQEGDYLLRIEASDSDGKWTGTSTTLAIKVLPPWYRSWWAYLLYVAAVAFLAQRYISYRNKQLKLKFEVKLTRLSMQKEREMNERRQAFFTNVSHEFRTPLTLIIDPVKELLKEKREGKEQAKLKIVQRNARRLLSLVDQLLLFRKAEYDEQRLKPSQFDFISFSKEIYLCFAHQAEVHNIRYTFEADDKPVFVEADIEKIEIILYNLLSNAFKFTPDDGQIALRIQHRKDEIFVEVSDTGVGISSQLGNQIFNKFYSEQRNGVKKKPGFGIGMYLTKSLVEMHQGKIVYQSVVKEGTTFSLRLPIAIAHQLKAVQHAFIENKPIVVPELLSDSGEDDSFESDAAVTPPRMEQIISEKVSLLIVDDDKQIRDYLVELFESNYHVQHAKSGEEAWKLVEKEQPDVVISDVVMGELNGIELCRKIKTSPRYGHIQVVLLTNSSSDAFKLEGIEEGADDYISKPFDTDVLRARVQALIKNRKNLQRFFYNAITLQSNDLKISPQDKEFIEKCIQVVEKHMTEEDFNVKKLAEEVGVSHSALYKRVKAISDKTVNEFIRDIKLRKAAQLFIDTDLKVNEAANMTGFFDIKYFRVQFAKLFGMNPSDYIKQYRKAFQNEYRVHNEE